MLNELEIAGLAGYVMLVSWAVHPIIYIVSPEGTCVASESAVTISFIVADFFSKNCASSWLRRLYPCSA